VRKRPDIEEGDVKPRRLDQFPEYKAEQAKWFLGNVCRGIK
jgi:hypothetical protein